MTLTSNDQAKEITVSTDAKAVRHDLVWTRFWVSHKYTAATLGALAVTMMATDGALKSPQATFAWVEGNWWTFLIAQFIGPTLRGIVASREQPAPTQAVVEEAKKA